MYIFATPTWFCRLMARPCCDSVARTCCCSVVRMARLYKRWFSRRLSWFLPLTLAVFVRVHVNDARLVLRSFWRFFSHCLVMHSWRCSGISFFLSFRFRICNTAVKNLHFITDALMKIRKLSSLLWLYSYRCGSPFYTGSFLQYQICRSLFRLFTM